MYDNTEVYGGRTQNQSFTLGKVFGYMFCAIMFSFAIAGIVYLALMTGFVSETVYVPLVYVASIALFIETIVIQFRFLRGRKSILVPFAIYAATMGIMLSVIMVAFDLSIIFTSLGISAVLFGVLALIGYNSKKSMMSVGYVAMGLLIGMLILTIFNFAIQSDAVGWLVSFGVFAAIMLFTAFDVWRIKKIIESGDGTKNLALYCAFHLYFDFIYLFIRIIMIVGQNAGRR